MHEAALKGISLQASEEDQAWLRDVWRLCAILKKVGNIAGDAWHGQSGRWGRLAWAVSATVNFE